MTTNLTVRKMPQPFKSGRIFRISGWRRIVFWPLNLLVRLYLSTLRIRGSSETLENLRDSSESMLLVAWHNQSLVMSEVLRRFRDLSRICCLVSPSRFAAWEEAFLSSMGYVTVRGSSSRRSIAATREIVARYREGYDMAITPDGPSGPLYDFKRGALFLARITDAPILIGNTRAHWAWRLRTWDQHLIPLPFAKVHLSVLSCPRFSGLEVGSEEEAAHLLRNRLMEISDCHWNVFRESKTGPDSDNKKEYRRRHQ